MIGLGEELDVTVRMIVLMLILNNVTSLTETRVPIREIVVAIFFQ